MIFESHIFFESLEQERNHDSKIDDSLKSGSHPEVSRHFEKIVADFREASEPPEIVFNIVLMFGFWERVGSWKRSFRAFISSKRSLQQPG